MTAAEKILKLLKGRKRPLSNREIAEKTGLKLTTASRVMNELEWTGRVAVVTQRKGAGRPANLYAITSYGEKSLATGFTLFS